MLGGINPIENFFAKLKHWLRKAAERTIDTICHAITHTLDTVTPTECNYYFLKAGYDRT
jgi:transposase